MASSGLGFGGAPSPVATPPRGGVGAWDVVALDIAVPPHVVDVPPDVGDVLAMVDDVLSAITRLQREIEQRWHEAIAEERGQSSEYLADTGHALHRALLILGQTRVIG